MNNASTPTSSPSYDMAPALEAALTTLERFSANKPSLPLRTSIRRIKSFVKEVFFQKKTVDQEMIALQHAIETLTNYYPLIEKWQAGLPRERALAQRVLTIIGDYNGSLERRCDINKSGLFSLIFKRSKKNLTPSIKLKTPLFSAKVLDPSIAALSFQPYKKTATLSTQEKDMFIMKGITLSNTENVQQVDLKETPIEIVEESEEVIRCMQVIVPLPGEVIIVKGAFRRMQEGRSIPIQDSFQLSSTAAQTAYPHAMQHNGWTFGNDLIPKYPHRLDKLNEIALLLDRKRVAACELLPQGALNRRAKVLLNNRRGMFNSNKKELLGLHRTLLDAFLRAAPEALLPPNVKNILDTFYTLISGEENCYELLCTTFETLSTTGVVLPYQLVQEHRLNTPTFQQDIQEKGAQLLYNMLRDAATFNRARLLQRSTPLEKGIYSFIQTVGPVFSAPAHTLLLQEFSEILLFNPPLLNEFERKVQAAVYMQLLDFLKELEAMPTKEETLPMMRTQLQKGAALMKENILPSLYESLLNELEEYYSSRYHSRQGLVERTLLSHTMPTAAWQSNIKQLPKSS